ncbi:MAG: chromosome partitioning protein ParB [Gammaproteobacteria bacterium]|jgi:ParB family chromosome partitioning protein|nr:chromosome partitioning protein ParB [Gammaproteobacteria bacterium]
MDKKDLLLNRKRSSELSTELHEVSMGKKDELLALKLQVMNDIAEASGKLFELPIERLQADPNQPRKTFRNIEGLAESIKHKGIIQPIIVRPRNQNGEYIIIAGERRFQAAKLAGLGAIPCIIRDEEDANILILQLLENDQRDSVSPFEESVALSKLVESMGVSKAQAAAELGRDPAWISIRLGLQGASEAIKNLADEGIIEDIRTLHELRKLEKESPAQAKVLIEKIRNNQLSGSYRQVISNYRTASKKKSKQPARLKKVQRIERVGEQLFLHVGGKHPVQFHVSEDVMNDFLAESLVGML